VTSIAHEFQDPSPEDLRRVAEYVPRLTDPELVIGVVQGGEHDSETGAIQYPWVAYAHVVRDWMQALYDHNVVTGYGEEGWQDEMNVFLADPTQLAAADLLTIRKVLTTIVREERFCDGAIMSAFERGSVQAAMVRLAELASNG